MESADVCNAVHAAVDFVALIGRVNLVGQDLMGLQYQFFRERLVGENNFVNKKHEGSEMFYHSAIDLLDRCIAVRPILTVLLPPKPTAMMLQKIFVFGVLSSRSKLLETTCIIKTCSLLFDQIRTMRDSTEDCWNGPFLQVMVVCWRL